MVWLRFRAIVASFAIAYATVLATTAVSCSRDSGSPPTASVRSPEPSVSQQQAILKAEEALRDEGILTGDVVEADATLTTLGKADEELVGWGAVLASYAAYPPSETPVWLVRILGYAIAPGPPRAETSEECTAMRVIITVDPFEDFNIFGKASDDC